MGKVVSSAVEYNMGNNLLSEINNEGWVTFRTICQTFQGWSPTVERSFYIKTETSDGLPQADFVRQTSDVYDLSGRKVSPNPQLPKGIYIINGKKIMAN